MANAEHQAADVPVAIAECSNQIEAQVLAARLKSYGIDATVSAGTARGGLQLPAGNRVFVHGRDADRAKALAAEPDTEQHDPSGPTTRRGRFLWRLFGGTT